MIKIQVIVNCDLIVDIKSKLDQSELRLRW